MKKMPSLALAWMMVFTLAACGGNDNDGSNINGGDTASNNSSNKQVGTTDESNNENTQDSTNDNDGLEDIKIKLTFNNEEVIVNMYDNPTNKDFMERLPLTLTFEDYKDSKK